MPNDVCVITGVGSGTGAALARRFAAAGYRIAMLARSTDTLGRLEAELADARGYACDVADAGSVHDTFERIRGNLGTPTVLLHNAGSGVFSSFVDTTPDLFEASWRTNALGLLLCAHAVVPGMLEAGRGAIVVTGATASLRGGANFTAFAAAKAAQRSLAQSMARGLGPRGIHVAYVIVDGVIDIPNTRALFPDRPDEFFLRADAIAETVHHVAHQEPSAWTFELDVRPFGERW